MKEVEGIEEGRNVGGEVGRKEGVKEQRHENRIACMGVNRRFRYSLDLLLRKRSVVMRYLSTNNPSYQYKWARLAILERTRLNNKL